MALGGGACGAGSSAGSKALEGYQTTAESASTKSQGREPDERQRNDLERRQGRGQRYVELGLAIEIPVMPGPEPGEAILGFGFDRVGPLK